MHCLLSCAQDTVSSVHFLPPLCPVLVYHSNSQKLDFEKLAFGGQVNLGVHFINDSHIIVLRDIFSKVTNLRIVKGFFHGIFLSYFSSFSLSIHKNRLLPFWRFYFRLNSLPFYLHITFYGTYLFLHMHNNPRPFYNF